MIPIKVKPVIDAPRTHHREARINNIALKLSKHLNEHFPKYTDASVILTGIIHTSKGEINSYKMVYYTPYKTERHFSVRLDGKVQLPYNKLWRGNNAIFDILYDKFYFGC